MSPRLGKAPLTLGFLGLSHHYYYYCCSIAPTCARCVLFGGAGWLYYGLWGAREGVGWCCVFLFGGLIQAGPVPRAREEHARVGVLVAVSVVSWLVRFPAKPTPVRVPY